MKATRITKESILILVLMSFFGYFALRLGQDFSWDLKSYHFYNAYAFLHHRFDWDIAPAQMHSFYNPLFDLLNYFIINNAPNARWAEFLLGSLHGIAVYFLFKITCYIIRIENPILRYFYIILGVLLGVTGSASIPQIGMALNESQISIFVMAAVFLALKYINDTGSTRVYFCLLSGAILGLGVGLKLTAVSYPIAFFVALLFHKKPDINHLKLVLLTGVIFSICFSLTGGFWMWTLYQHFQNPFFPFYNNIFHSIYGSQKSFTDAQFLPTTIKLALLYPFYWVHKTTVVEWFPMADARIAATFVLGGLFLCYVGYQKLVGKLKKSVVSESETLSVRFICLFFYLSYFTWLIQFSIYRFTIPLNFLAGILIIYFGIKLLKQSFLQFIVLLCISIFIMHTTIYPDWGRKLHYNKYFFEVKIPPIPNGSMVILVGASPIGYLLPYFPADTRFIALYNYFVNSDAPVFQKRAFEIIQNHHGPLYVLVDSTDPSGSHTDFKVRQKDILRRFGLLRIDDMCRPIISNMENAPIPLCAVIKIHNK